MPAQDQLDDDDAVCPYCQHENHIEGEDVNEDSMEQTCQSCDMHFWLRSEMSFTHHTRGDCALNGFVHKWEPLPLTPGYVVCPECDKVQRA